MTPFEFFQGLVAPIDRENVDTDAIIPKQYLKSIKKTGFGPHLFDEWRYLNVEQSDSPSFNADIERAPNPNFVLNQARYQGASILLARANFGCGSSREHAPWAIAQYGFKALIAPSFADIFLNNCFNNGLLVIEQPNTVIGQLFDEVAACAGYALGVDLAKQHLIKPDGSTLDFAIDPSRKHRLLLGLDDIGETLQHADKIKAFEQRRLQQQPWLNQSL